MVALSYGMLIVEVVLSPESQSSHDLPRTKSFGLPISANVFVTQLVVADGIDGISKLLSEPSFTLVFRDLFQ